MAFFPDSEHLVCAVGEHWEESGSVLILDADTLETTRTIDLDAPVTAVTYSPDGAHIFASNH